MQTRILLPCEDTYKKCGKIIKEGGLVAFPTETVYGLGANVFLENAVKSIFSAKGRPSDNPLIVHIADVEDINKVALSITPVAKILIQNFMPGPLTLVLKKKPCINNFVSGGLDTVGVRIPSNKVARDFLRECNVPVCAPSANTSSRPSPTQAVHVYDDLKGVIPYIIDGSNCEIGIESTVVDATGDIPVILRPGKVTAEDIKAICGQCYSSFEDDGGQIKSPGVKYRHYAPACECILIDSHNKDFIAEIYNRQKAEGKNPILLCYDDIAKSLSGYNIINLGKDNNDFAANFYSALRLGEKTADVILVETCKDGGIKESLLNRITKASGKKHY